MYATQGQYKITASHATWKFKKSEAVVTASFGKAAILETFGVLGYDVSGSVAWVGGGGGGGGMVGVSLPVLLMPGKAGAARPSGLNCKLSGSAAKSGAWCSATTDSSGRYNFEGVAPGSYLVVLEDLDRFDVTAPKGAAVTVAHGSASATVALEIARFRVGGKVVDASGSGVMGADVLVNGKKAATTDAAGGYTLAITPGVFDITATKEHTVFDKLSKYDLSPHLRRIGTLSVQQYAVCGDVALDSTSSSGITVTASPKNVGGGPHMTKTDGSGKFCLQLPLGVYSLSVSGTSAVVSPASLDVDLRKSPVLNAHFGQAALLVRGTVVGLETACNGFEVVLEQRGKVIAKSNKTPFTFDDVPAGTYVVKVFKEGWCWESETVTVRVGSEDSSAVKFIQNGFLKTLTGSQGRDETVTLKHSSGSSHQLRIPAGATTVCLPKSGDFVLDASPSACQRPATAQFSSSSAAPLDLTPASKAVVIKVKGVGGGDVSFKITAGGGGGGTTQVPASREDGAAIAKYWGAVSEQIEITPQSTDASVIFNPPSSIHIVGAREGEACPGAAVVFAAMVGQMLSGSVIPAMAGVSIIAYKASGAEVARIETNDDGQYSIGPLEGEGYTLRAEKTNFQFKEEGVDFRSVKLGQVALRAVDEKEGLVPGVLLSLSGDAGFRHNNKTGDDGMYTFSGLLPGDYLLRPMYKA